MIVHLSPKQMKAVRDQELLSSFLFHKGKFFLDNIECLGAEAEIFWKK